MPTPATEETNSPWTLDWRGTVGSTSDVARELAQAGAPEGTAVAADEQTAGRGTRGRTWRSAPGQGLWMSVILRPDWSRSLWTRLTPAAAVAVCRTILGAGVENPVIKWPNDVLLGGRKICGILTETRGDFAICGIGLNLTQQPEDWPEELRGRATSLAAETGRTADSFDRKGLGRSLLAHLRAVHTLAGTDAGFASVREEYALRCRPGLGEAAWARLPEESEPVAVRGAGLDAEGRLLLERRAGGEVFALVSGEILWDAAPTSPPAPWPA